MKSTPTPSPTDAPRRRHWSRHLVRVIAFAAIVAIVAYLYARGAR
jgi:hypothetical protein